MPQPVQSLYPVYKSPYGPKTQSDLEHLRYHYQPHVAGFTPQQAVKFGFKAGAFGGVALFAVIFYASGIPRVQKDILQKIPGLYKFYDNPIPASDNPF